MRGFLSIGRFEIDGLKLRFKVFLALWRQQGLALALKSTKPSFKVVINRREHLRDPALTRNIINDQRQ